jgi:hypothetical protein
VSIIARFTARKRKIRLAIAMRNLRYPSTNPE